MYRVTTVDNPQNPPNVVYQGEVLEKAVEIFETAVTCCTSVDMFVWRADNGGKKAKWMTARIYKKYR